MMREDPWLSGLIKGDYIKQGAESGRGDVADGSCGGCYGPDSPAPWVNHPDSLVEADGERLQFWELTDAQYDDEVGKLAEKMVHEQTDTAQAQFRRAKLHRLSGDFKILSIYQVLSIDAAFLRDKCPHVHEVIDARETAKKSKATAAARANDAEDSD